MRTPFGQIRCPKTRRRHSLNSMLWVFCHTIFYTPSFTHIIFQAQLCHTQFFTHTIFHTPLCHTPSFTKLFHTPSFTHHFVKHHLSHTIFDTTSLTHTIFHTPSQTIFHTPLCHTPSLTHHLSHTTLSRTIFHRTTPPLSHTIFHHTIFHTHNFVTHHLSSTSSFVFPSFPVPATTFLAHHWKKLTCGVFRSFYFPSFSGNLLFELMNSIFNPASPPPIPTTLEYPPSPGVRGIAGFVQHVRLDTGKPCQIE